MTAHSLPAELLERPVKVHLVGCGGNGSQMLHGLARLHHALVRLGHPGGFQVSAFDPDKVSEANIGRQLFFPSDRGRRKCSVLVNRINLGYQLVPGWRDYPVRWGHNAVNHSLGGGMWLREHPDILISCVDSAASRREIAEEIGKCLPRPAYWLDLGNRQADGQVILGQPENPPAEHRLPIVLEVFPELNDPTIPEDDRPSCSLAEALESQGLFINQWISTAALQILEDLFRTGKTRHSGAFVNLTDGAVRFIPVTPAVSAIGRHSDRRRAA